MFINEDIKSAYDGRYQRMRDVINKRQPDRVPVVMNAQSWIMHYTGTSMKKAYMEDGNVLFEAFKKYLMEVYNDALMDLSNTGTYKLMIRLGGGLFHVADDCIQTIGGKGEVMRADEYDQMAADPQKYLANVYIPRKFPIFKQSFNDNVALMKEVFKEFLAFGEYNAAVARRIAFELGVPLFVNGANYNPLDAFMDFFRDFHGITMDIKRRPKELYEACESFYDYIMEMFTDSNIDPKEDKLLFSAFHIPTYLNRKDFERAYYPFMKKYVEEAGVKRGYALYFFMENNWEPYIDFVQDLPKEARIVMLFERGNMKLFKEKLGKQFTIMGGMPIDLLGYSDKQTCIDKAKECIDTLAPGGNYIFSTDRVALSLVEAKPENLIAVSQFVHEYGKY